MHRKRSSNSTISVDSGARGASGPRKGQSPPAAVEQVNLANLLSACLADTGATRKGDLMSQPLPPRANLEQLRKQAKSLLKGKRAFRSEALARIRESSSRLRNL